MVEMDLGVAHRPLSKSRIKSKTMASDSTENSEGSAGEAGLNVGASPTRRVGLFTTEHNLHSAAVRRGWKRGKLNRRAVTKVNHI